MQENRIQLKELLSGLRLQHSVAWNTGKLITASGLYREGDYYKGDAGTTVSVDSTYTWPWPQPMNASLGLFIGTATGLYKYTDPSNVYAVSTPGFWTHADFVDFVLFTNGGELVAYKDGVFTAVTDETIPIAGCITDVNNGRVIAGDLPLHYAETKLRADWVAWSKIGQLSFALDRTNTGGYAPVYGADRVLAVKSLGSSVVAYGAMAIGLLTPYETGYGLKQAMPVGISNRGAVVKAENGHYAVLTTGDLVRITEEGISFLGYKEFLSGLSMPVLTHDRLNRTIYISGSAEHYTYSLTHSVLTGPHNGVGIVGYHNNSTLKFVPMLSEPSHNLVTDAIGFDRPGHKTMKWIELFGTIPAGTSIRVRYATAADGAVYFGPVKTVPPIGVLSYIIGGYAFYVDIIFTDSAFKVTEMKIAYQPTDRRFLRGTNV